MDWGIGHYEQTAVQLLGAARLVVDRAAPSAGEHVVDVGCGTGNAALLAAAHRARVTGVDPSERLLAVARAQAAADGLEATFLAGEAAALPLADGEADVVLSVFGAIFAPDGPAALREMARVTAPSGRMVFTAWIPEGAIRDAVAIARESGAPPGPPAFAWHDRDTLGGVLEPLGFTVSLTEERLSFTGASAREYVDGEFANHPLWVARAPGPELRERVLAVLEAGNEDPEAFRVTSRYVVATAAATAAAGRAPGAPPPR